MKNFFAIIVLFVLALTSCHFKNKDADLILHNAVIYAVDDSFNTYEALAIKDGRIIAIGKEREILNEYNAPKVIDCGKKFIYPGFIDAHCHFLGYGRTLQQVNLVGTTSFDEVIQKVVEHAKLSTDEWITGRGWDQNDWAVQEFPDRQILDSLFPNRPVMLKRIDGHAMLVNEKALELAGINLATTVEGGTIVYQNGRLTGVLVDNAMNLVENILPHPTKEFDIRALLDAQKNCFNVGLTTVDDAGIMKEDIDLIKELHAKGDLKMRIYAMLSDQKSNYDYYLQHGIDTTDRLSVRAFKFYADGALGSRGACLLAPYSDVMPGPVYGMLLDSITHFRRSMWELRERGFQVCTHAIGDSANRAILNIYEEMTADLPDLRWRIEHAQVVHENDLPRFGKLNIIPSIQPTHATSDMPWAELRLGRNRVRRAYTYRELKEQMGMTALGTDFPIEDISPIKTFYAAVSRKDLNGQPEEGWQKENALTREDALRGMTIWAAIANFEENKKGSLEVGKFADIVMLDRDILKVEEKDLPATEVLMTIVGGEVVK
ncbi:MAG: amidohydrolase [Flavobacteriales bacterium]|nr:amidohydrolase [Flavobacteriales bacterium]